MFAKKNRLAKTSDVQKVFARGRSFFNPLFTVKFLPQPGVVSRFTVVVSTKVSKAAVRRNRIKRVLRQFLRIHLAEVRSGDYVVIVKPPAVQKQADDWRKGLEDLLKKSKLWLNFSKN